MASQPDEASSGFSALKMFRNLGLSASAACIAEATTLPLDTAKVRFAKASCAQLHSRTCADISPANYCCNPLIRLV